MESDFRKDSMLLTQSIAQSRKGSLAHTENKDKDDQKNYFVDGNYAFN